MASWAPTAANVRAESSERNYPDDTLTPAIASAVIDVISEVGPFDETWIINPDEPADDQVTLGDLARMAAAARAAQIADVGSFPEQSPYGETSGGQPTWLFARYRDRLDQLRRWILSSRDTPADPDMWSGTVPLTLPSVPQI